MSTPAAIETRYAGCRFRSRLEARWAVAFDALGITWTYEPQGYNLDALVPPNTRPSWLIDMPARLGYYLPDFQLPSFDLYWEVKGAPPTNPERWRARAFGLACARGLTDASRFVVAHGDIPRSDRSPGLVAYEALDRCLTAGVAGRPLFGDAPDVTAYSDEPSPLEGHYLAYCTACDRLDVGGAGPFRMWPARCGDEHDYRDDHPRVLAAYAKARSARFEHGETP